MSIKTFCAIASILVLAATPFGTFAQTAQSSAHAMRHVESPGSFDETVQRLEKSITANKMGLVAQASASRGAAARGVKIRGNIVLMVFRNDYAVRMLAASVAAGFEAPIRIYVTEDDSGRTSIRWRAPSTLTHK